MLKVNIFYEVYLTFIITPLSVNQCLGTPLKALLTALACLSILGVLCPVQFL